MRVAVVDSNNAFSARWLQRAKALGLGVEVVDPYRNDVIDTIRGFEAFLWHIPMHSLRDDLMARHLIRAAELMGVKTFPSTRTLWVFDDKIAQKYLLEAIGCNFVPTHIFYDRRLAIRWLESARFPVVQKLKRGAGSRNVHLLTSRSAARQVIEQSFRSGYPVSAGNVSDSLVKIRSGRLSARELFAKVMRAPRTLARVRRINRDLPRERGYVYFQEFLEGNTHDTRITVIGERAVAFRRRVRPNDFRASGSGDIDYDQASIDQQCIAAAFKVADTFESQSLCLDFVHDGEGTPRIIEVSYAYDPGAVHRAGGFWTRDLSFVETPVWPQDAILDDLLDDIRPDSGV